MTLEEYAAKADGWMSNTPTLRDQFAMAALQGFLGNPIHAEGISIASEKVCGENLPARAAWIRENFSEMAFKYADAMLAEREKGAK